MITIKKKRFLFTVREHWFGYKFNWTNLFLPACYLVVRQPIRFFGVKTPYKTAVLPLDKPLVDIFNNFSTSHIRYIKKAAGEGVQCFFNNDRKGFIEFYNEFAKRKELFTLDSNRLDEFCGAEWNYFFAVLNDQVLVAHSYLQDNETGIVRLMQSGSLRFDEQYDPGQIARASKLLHYFSIKYYKEAGLQEYDFGGWANQDSLLKFKLAFGAKIMDVYHYYNYSYLLKDKLKEIGEVIKKQFHYHKIITIIFLTL